MESRGIEFQRRVREGFLTLAEEFQDKFILVDGSASIEQVHQQVLDALPQEQP